MKRNLFISGMGILAILTAYAIKIKKWKRSEGGSA